MATDPRHTQHPLRLGTLDCLNRFMVAPMCDVTSWPYRKLCRDHGCGLLFTEMISSVGLAHSGERTLKMMEFDPEEAPVAVQISGCAVEHMETAARMVQDYGASMLNVNCGCPVKKVIQGGSGAALLRDLGLLTQICHRLRKVLTIPFTIKVRAGWDANSVNAIEVGRIAEGEGLDGLMIHARTRVQLYEGKADWSLIKRLKESVSIPVIGNGDAFDPDDALRMLEETGCDGVMLGRGAMGNPWVFRGCLAWERGQRDDTWRPNVAELYDGVREHLDRYVDWSGERLAVIQMRKQLIWYTQGLPGAKELRKSLPQLNTRGDMLSTLGRFLETVDPDRPWGTSRPSRAGFKEGDCATGCETPA